MEYNMINLFNGIIVAVLLVPSIIMAFKFKKFRNRCTNTAMNVCEWIGRFGAILFMVFPFGVGEFGFSHVNEFLIYLIANSILLLIYILIWISFMKKQSYMKAMIMAVVPAVIFLVCGITLRHFILIFCSVMFFIGHIYVTTSNYRTDKKEKKAAEQQAEEKTAADAETE